MHADPHPSASCNCAKTHPKVPPEKLSLRSSSSSEMAEILNRHWGDVKGNRLNLRDSKTGPRTVWLGSAAREVIAGIPRHKKLPWLFWNYRYRRQMRDVAWAWKGIRELAGLGHVRIHDLRHTFASHAAMNKETLPMIGRLLGHANHQSTARYAHLDDEYLVDAA